MEYLPTFTIKDQCQNVRKYSIHGPYGTCHGDCFHPNRCQDHVGVYETCIRLVWHGSPVKVPSKIGKGPDPDA